MRALRMLQEKSAGLLEFMHAKRQAAFWRAVEGLLVGQRLWLSALGRSLPGACSDKHRIKAIDRLLGNATMQSHVKLLYGVLATLLLRHIPRPVLIVDWTGADPGFAVLSAQLVFRGRAVSIFSRTFPKSRKCSPKAEREFLDALATIIPSTCTPTLVTDAGFLNKWFDAVQGLGWDFIGRLRGRQQIELGSGRMTLEQVHTLARRTRCRDLGKVRVGASATHRVVLSPKPKLKGRRRIGRNGARRRSTADRQRSEAARQPWVLATSLSDPCRLIAEAYGMRMQIEETFRDLKSHRYGWSAEDIRSKSEKRIDVLLLVAAFATIAMHIVGLAAVESELHHGLQANTIRHRTVFSTFFLAKLIVARKLVNKLLLGDLRAAFSRFLQSLHTSSACSSAC